MLNSAAHKVISFWKSGLAWILEDIKMSEQEYIGMVKWGFWIGVPAHAFYYWYIPSSQGLVENGWFRSAIILAYVVFYVMSNTASYVEKCKALHRWLWITFGAVQFIILPIHMYNVNGFSSFWLSSFAFCAMALVMFLKSFDIFIAAVFGLVFCSVFMHSPLEPKQQHSAAYLIFGEAFCVGGYTMIYIRSLQKKLQERLSEKEEALARLREYDAKKDEFVASIVHEIRTPLSVSMASVEDMLNSRLTDEAFRNHYLKAASGLKTVKSQINDLIAVEKLARGGSELDCVEVDVHAWLQGVAGRLSLLCRDKDIGFRCILNTRMSSCFDAEKLETVIGNLVSNSVKFTPLLGLVEVRFGCDESSNMYFEVSDTGCGIRAEDMPYVFEKYYQSKHNPDGSLGIGIGLALVKKIVDDHGGGIRVTSSPSKGTCVRVTLGKAKTRRSFQIVVVDTIADKKREQSQTAFDSGNESKNLSSEIISSTVFVVEDNMSVRHLLHDHFKMLGFQVHVFRSPASVLEALMAHPETVPDVVVTDMNMPDMSGLSLMLEVRKQYKGIPFVFVTAHTKIFDLLSEHTHAYVVEKPFVYQDLDNAVHGALFASGNQIEDAKP